MSELLSLQNASVSLGDRRVLVGVDLTVSAGELVGVLGPNGAGKTTLLRAALGLAKLASGSARLSGRDVAELGPEERAGRVAYLPQERRLAWSLAAWRVASLGAIDRPPALAREAALQALARVEMSGLADRGVLEMSGGERARVLLARLLATRARLLVADEPVAGLDVEAQFHTQDQLRPDPGGAGLRPGGGHRPWPHRRRRLCRRGADAGLPGRGLRAGRRAGGNTRRDGAGGQAARAGRLNENRRGA
jgi:iron complex transport system ATP-binding protein